MIGFLSRKMMVLQGDKSPRVLDTSGEVKVLVFRWFMFVIVRKLWHPSSLKWLGCLCLDGFDYNCLTINILLLIIVRCCSMFCFCNMFDVVSFCDKLKFIKGLWCCEFQIIFIALLQYKIIIVRVSEELFV